MQARACMQRRYLEEKSRMLRYFGDFYIFVFSVFNFLLYVSIILGLRKHNEVTFIFFFLVIQSV